MLVLNRSEASKGIELEAYKKKSIATVNEVCGEVRSKYVTISPGQELVYTEKKAEALAYLAADPEPTDLADFPFIAAEIGQTGESAYEVAQVIANLSAMWLAVGSGIEQIRVSSINAIKASASEAEIDAHVQDCRDDLSAY